MRVPRLRNGPLETQIFENYSRSETGLITGLMEMVIQGVSTRKCNKDYRGTVRMFFQQINDIQDLSETGS